MKMEHFFQKGTKPSHPTLLLLHGTGGDEHDLVPLAHMVDKDCSLLGVRGNVSENGMNRYFRRLSEGVFDEEDLRYRTKELNGFLDEAAVKYNFDRHNVIAIGYSNGANIAASLLFHYQDALKAAILLHPMVPLRNIDLPNLTGTHVFISAGTNDPICASSETKELASLLKHANAEVVLDWHQSGHQLTNQEVEAAAKWYQSLFHISS
jgi:phospholipase/carboxylesterase